MENRSADEATLTPRMIRRTHEAAGLHTTLIPLSAPQAETYYPHIGMTKHVLRGARFPVPVVRVVEQTEAASLKEYAERIRLRTCSTLELTSDEQYEDGLAALEAAAALEQNPQPVMARIDLLVFQRTAASSH